MLIHILTFSNPERLSPVTKVDLEMLVESAKRLGHKVEIIYDRDCQLVFNKKPEIHIQNKKRKNIKVILTRANFLNTFLEYRASIIHQFEITGIPVINHHLPVLRAKNKLRTIQILNKQKIPIPKSYLLSSSQYIDDAVKQFGSFPIILKTLYGSHGNGVTIIESKRGLRSIVEMMTGDENSNPIMLQEYVKEAKGKDIRVFIVGKRILAAMERIATKKGEFRSNFHLGGRVRVAEMSKKEKEIAFAAVSACGLDMAGVDILRTKKGPVVLEVNCNPGLEGITKATGRDIAGEIIKYTVKKANAFHKAKQI